MSASWAYVQQGLEELFGPEGSLGREMRAIERSVLDFDVDMERLQYERGRHAGMRRVLATVQALAQRERSEPEVVAGRGSAITKIHGIEQR